MTLSDVVEKIHGAGMYLWEQDARVVHALIEHGVDFDDLILAIRAYEAGELDPLQLSLKVVEAVIKGRQAKKVAESQKK